MVEVLGDRALGIPPLDRSAARRMIEQTRTSRVLRGFRGAPPADIESLIDVLIAVQETRTLEALRRFVEQSDALPPVKEHAETRMNEIL